MLKETTTERNQMFAIVTWGPTSKAMGYGPLIHYTGTEDEMLEMLTDPNSKRFPMPENGCWVNYDPERAGYFIMEVTEEQIAADRAAREQELRDQRAASWAM